MVSVCPGMSRLVDVGAVRLDKQAQGDFTAAQHYACACKADNAFPTEKTAVRICGAPGLWPQLRYS